MMEALDDQDLDEQAEEKRLQPGGVRLEDPNETARTPPCWTGGAPGRDEPARAAAVRQARPTNFSLVQCWPLVSLLQRQAQPSSGSKHRSGRLR